MYLQKLLKRLGNRSVVAAPMQRRFFADAATGIEFRLTEEQRSLQVCVHNLTIAGLAMFIRQACSLQELARRFAKEDMMPKSAKYDIFGEYPREVFNRAWELGLVNMHIPTEFGGAGLHAMEGVIVGEELAYGDTGMMAAIEINTVAEIPIILAGTENQKREYLGRMIAEPLQAAYCVTEPGAGSDVAGIQTVAVQKGNEWVINGSKMWITNAGVANWYFVLARTGAPSDSPGSAFTCFIVDRDTPGITVGKKERMMGQRCSDTRGVSFEDVRVPAKNVLGSPGNGFKVAMAAFDFTRPPVAAGAVGLARRALDEAIAYALQRKAMGKPIAQHQAIAFMIADMAAGIEAARLLTHRSAWLADVGRSNTKEAAMAKLFAGEHCNKVVYDALQIFGGAGFCEEFPVAKLARDARIYSIYEGTSQIQKLIISRALLTDLAATMP